MRRAATAARPKGRQSSDISNSRVCRYPATATSCAQPLIMIDQGCGGESDAADGGSAACNRAERSATTGRSAANRPQRRSPAFESGASMVGLTGTAELLLVMIDSPLSPPPVASAADTQTPPIPPSRPSAHLKPSATGCIPPSWPRLHHRYRVRCLRRMDRHRPVL